MKKHTEKKCTKKLKKVKIVEKNKEREFVGKNNNYGITLIALVITVIVLLILAGISISMLSGDNSILSNATKARTKTGNAQDEETISLAYLAAVTGKYAESSDMSTTIRTELEKTYGSGKVTVEKDNTTNSYTITITGKGTYKIDENGKVEKQGPTVNYANERIVESSDGTGTAVAAATKTPGDKLYIYFEASVECGTTNISPAVPFEITKNGTYNFTITSTVNGETFTTTKTCTANQYDLRAGIDVGDYVNYTPKTASTTYSKTNLGETYTGSTDNTSDLTRETLKWRVLKKYDDGRLDLIADPTNSTVYFKGATGYNNGVYIMHDICEKLYSNTDHNITARSVSLVDFENNMTDAGRNARDSFDNSGNSPQYGHTNYEKWGSTYSYRYYPNIYASENGSGIDTENGAIKIDGIEVNEKGTLDLSTIGNACKQAKKRLTSKQTYYNIVIDSTNYGDASKVLLQRNTYYWVASRYVNCEFSDAKFGLSRAKKSIMDGWDMRSSGYMVYNDNGSNLRPVVQLGSDVTITPSTTAKSETGTPHTINW